MFPSTGVREEGQLWNHHTLCHPPPFHNPYLILCFLFSVTIGPSWCVLGRCQDGDSKPAEFHSKWQPVKDWCLMKKLRGGRRKKKKKWTRQPGSPSKQRASWARRSKKCLTQARKAPHFGLAYQRNISFWRHCQTNCRAALLWFQQQAAKRSYRMEKSPRFDMHTNITFMLNYFFLSGGLLDNCR